MNFHSLARSDQPSIHKSTSASPLIFQAPMRSPKEFSPALWTFNSFSNDLLAVWPLNDHANSNVLPIWDSVPLITKVSLDRVYHSHTLRNKFPRKFRIKEHGNITQIPHKCMETSNHFQVKNALIICTSFILTRDSDEDMHFLGCLDSPVLKVRASKTHCAAVDWSVASHGLLLFPCCPCEF